jgi:hypothetical protein
MVGAPEEQHDNDQFIDFVVHLLLQGSVRDGKRAGPDTAIVLDADFWST